MKPNSNTIILVATALFIAALGYWYLGSGSDSGAVLTAASTGNPAQGRFESLVGELGPITFNTDVLSDPRFNALVDLSTPIATEASGRIDPFAPVPGVAVQ